MKYEDISNEFKKDLITLLDESACGKLYGKWSQFYVLVMNGLRLVLILAGALFYTTVTFVFF